MVISIKEDTREEYTPKSPILQGNITNQKAEQFRERITVPVGREREAMGHGSSKEENGAAESQSKGSRRARLKQRLHLHRRRRSRSNSPSHSKRLDAENFAGIALLTLVRVSFLFFVFCFIELALQCLE